MNVAVLVPRRSDNGPRDELWAFCRRFWNHPIFEGYHEDGPFNRSAAINRAAEAAGDWDVALVVDGDVHIDPNLVEQAVQSAADTGRACFAFTDYYALNRTMTSRVLDGFAGNWKQGGLDSKMEKGRHISSCIAVPRRLWDKVHGFDERFEGWGFEDNAFFYACRVLGGGVDRIPGAIYHLWHPTSPERDKTTPEYRAGQALSHRYQTTLNPSDMALLSGGCHPDSTLLLVMTDGRREAIERTIPSAFEYLDGIDERVIVDDSGDADYQAWLRLRFPAFGLICGPKRLGYTKAMQRVNQIELGSGLPWIFRLEDDFVFQRPVDLAAMQRTMCDNPHLVQLALRRQAWFPNELEAGGIIEANPTAFTQRDGFIEHGEFFTNNPTLLRRSFIAANPWPDARWSEAVFGRNVLRGDARSAFLGSTDDEPWVEHIGIRQGTGY